MHGSPQVPVGRLRNVDPFVRKVRPASVHGNPGVHGFVVTFASTSSVARRIRTARRGELPPVARCMATSYRRRSGGGDASRRLLCLVWHLLTTTIMKMKSWRSPLPKPFWISVMLLPPLIALAGACGSETSSFFAMAGSAGSGGATGNGSSTGSAGNGSATGGAAGRGGATGGSAGNGSATGGASGNGGAA